MKQLKRETYVASMQDYLELCHLISQRCSNKTSENYKPYNDRDIVILSCMALLGLRVNETVTLRLQDIDFDSDTLTVRAETTKTGVERKIYLHLHIKKILQKYINTYAHRFSKESYVFFSRRKKNSPHIIASTYSHIIKKVLRQAGMVETRFISANNKRYTKLTPYCFRRAFCRELRIKNPKEPLENLAKVTGHKSLDVLNNFYIKLETRPIQERLLNKTFSL